MNDEPTDNDSGGLPLRIAFYLPQFAVIPENDAWYGRGFTEWTNLVKSRPLYNGHRQPELPGELGFYDLRVPETRVHQAQLAKDHGISGFCYYHYWFNGRRILDRTFDEVLTSGVPQFPFCLLWCNESWYKRWHDSHDEMLIEQTYDEADDIDHIRWLIEVFKDPRYIRVNGRPLLCVYVPADLPNPEKVTSLWKNECRLAGVPEPWLVGFETFQGTFLSVINGFNASAEFIPHGITEYVSPVEETKKFRRFDYNEVVQFYSERSKPDWLRYPCIVPGWDNSPRRQNGNAVIISGSNPESYATWLEHSLLEQRRQNGSNGVVFINAWNEWCEGAHLEPDSYWGRSYLEATKRVVESLGESLPLDPVGNLEPDVPRTIHVPSIEESYESLYKRFIEVQKQKSADENMVHNRLEELKDQYQIVINDTVQQLDELGQLLIERDEQQVEIVKQLNESRAAQLLPIQGYLEQVGPAIGFYPGGWTAPDLTVRLRPNRLTSGLTISAYLPPASDRVLMAFINNVLVATAGVSVEGLTTMEILMDTPLEDEFELHLQVSTPYFAEDDERELGVLLVGIEAQH